MKRIFECDRCKVKVTMPSEAPPSNQMNGWIRLLFMRNNLTICPSCAHELKRFLGGMEIKKLLEVKTHLIKDASEVTGIHDFTDGKDPVGFV